MKNQSIAPIPVAEIRITNPRSRNPVAFQAIKASIARVGLKKPITVCQRTMEDDGTRYDLVCGQGRLESVIALGDVTIPAIINDVPEGERYLMGLIENLARRQSSSTDLLREVKRLSAQRYKATAIAQKLGYDKSYISAIVHLLSHGEEELIARVEAGRLPIETAVMIATGSDAELQRALSDAYESGSLRGEKLRIVQQIISRRKMAKSPQAAKPALAESDLVREYEQHTQQQRALVRRAALIGQRLALVNSSFRRLAADGHFVTLLRAENLGAMPQHLVVQATTTE